MKKLRQKYKEVKDKSKQTGNAASKKWKFFDEIDAFLTQRHNVNPPVVVDTMAHTEGHVHEEDNHELSESEVDDMVGKYGAGETSLHKCPSCDYEQEIRSSGVHISEGGAASVFSEDDEFCCPNCVLKASEQAIKMCRDDNYNSENDDEPSTSAKNITDAVESKENSQEKTSSEKKTLNQENLSKLPVKKKKKSNVEKSLEVVFEKFKESSATEFERYQKLEDERLKKEHEFRMQQLKLENERRKEERIHELNMLRIMMSPQPQRPTVTTGYQVFNSPIGYNTQINPYSSDSGDLNSSNEYPTHDSATYFRL